MALNNWPRSYRKSVLFSSFPDGFPKNCITSVFHCCWNISCGMSEGGSCVYCFFLLFHLVLLCLFFFSAQTANKFLLFTGEKPGLRFKYREDYFLKTTDHQRQIMKKQNNLGSSLNVFYQKTMFTWHFDVKAKNIEKQLFITGER